MWIEPIQQGDMIPENRRDDFIEKVFSNLIEIHKISMKLSIALRLRQQEHPIVSHVSDIMEQFVSEVEPFIHYGARQHRAKHVFEHERYNNPRFALFAEKTERDVSSRKLELNGYLTKPTTRLGRYTLLLDKIHDRTTPNHPDKENLPFVINSIKHVLQKVNTAAGVAKNRFDLELIENHLSFKYKKDTINLRLKDSQRCIIKQGMLRKSQSFDSSEYQVILFDHYLVIAKVKVIHAVEHYIIQKRVRNNIFFFLVTIETLIICSLFQLNCWALRLKIPHHYNEKDLLVIYYFLPVPFQNVLYHLPKSVLINH